MTRLSIALNFYIYERLNNDPLWKELIVILSDSQVPGEGEHKILEYIRLQRVQDHYDPNTIHCLYGADADLIMLGLSTHEVNFYLLREIFVFPSEVICSLCGQRGHTPKQCIKHIQKSNIVDSVQFQYISIWRIREYLELEFRNVKTPFTKDFERIVDDFVFLCFFVGNDFIPQLPSMYIRQGALDSILIIYKKLLPNLGGYLTCEGKINYKRLNAIFEKLTMLEEALFKEKGVVIESTKKQRGLATKITNQENYLEERKQEVEQKISTLRSTYIEKIKKEELYTMKDQLRIEYHQIVSTHMVELRDINSKLTSLKQQSNLLKQKKTSKEELIKKFNKDVKRMIEQAEEEEAAKYKDTINFAKEGYKTRYYLDKFNISSSDFAEFKVKIQRSYIEGLSWILDYYYNGCPSWNWYYPYHYSPLTCDLLGIEEMTEIKFDKGQPYRPFEQLMSILPPTSSHALPKILQELINNPKSEIADFYPTQFRLDINGQRFAWMGVNLLPFIEEDRLFKVLKKCEVSSFKYYRLIMLHKKLVGMSMDQTESL